MPQYFNLAEAEALLPEVEKSIRGAVESKRIYQDAEQLLQNEARRIAYTGGAMVDSARLRQERQKRDACASRLKQALDHIHSFGCEVKDLDMGLIDFRTFYQGQEVYLCWKLGEAGIHYWHGLEEGYRGRKKIDEDFLKNHRGRLRA
ncbi:MAG: DUF2203 domain-containing protein [Acidobacteria bacterium]|nr:DUF2203 domain-containing protein [Acidobacteriota bacterium]